jgi:hypothetical protein
MQSQKEHDHAITKPFYHEHRWGVTSHASIVSHPLQVFDLIQAAAQVGATKK